ncbi:restriction endonuclease [Helicobacter pylori]|uniref:restriction endonuclease n=1 Tax=Helicobacter pylori TaxID=210 RepID=UPI00165C9ECF|nr:restriction endonuclease [Helicobacter pylori]
MSDLDITTQLIDIDPHKECLQFLGDRVLSDDYRGWHLSQHNRYDQNTICIILEEIHKIVGNKRMQVRDQDMSKRSELIPGEEQYGQLVENVNKILGIGTQDSLRKNFFVDMHRMGLIDRYGASGEKLYPYERSGHIKYIGLAPLGLKLVEAHRKGGQEASKLYYDEGLKNLGVCAFGERCLEIMDSLKTPYLTEYESMFFVTASNLDTNTIARYINEFRLLGDLTKKVIELVQNYCDPNNFSGDKSNKRDFGNWKNETQQIFSLLAQAQNIPLRYDNLLNRIIRV